MRVGNGGAAGHVEHRQRPRLYRRRWLGLDLRGGGTTETPSAWAGRCASVRGGLTDCPRSRDRDHRHAAQRIAAIGGPGGHDFRAGSRGDGRDCPKPSACRSSRLGRAGAATTTRSAAAAGLTVGLPRAGAANS